MDRGPVYQVAKDKVKIGIITERGIDLKGVIHVGANDGYEIEFYRLMGLKVVAFEPLESAFLKLMKKYEGDGEVFASQNAIGIQSTTRFINETVSTRGMDDSGGSSFLKEITPSEHTVIDQVPCLILSVKDILEMFKTGEVYMKAEDYDCLVVDVQGMELEVLQSFDEAGIMQNFKGMNVECSRVPVYEGEAPAEKVVDWLLGKGFTNITPIEDHNDIIFIRTDLL